MLRNLFRDIKFMRTIEFSRGWKIEVEYEYDEPDPAEGYKGAGYDVLTAADAVSGKPLPQEWLKKNRERIEQLLSEEG